MNLSVLNAGAIKQPDIGIVRKGYIPAATQAENGRGLDGGGGGFLCCMSSSTIFFCINFTYCKIYNSNMSVGDSQMAVQPVLTWQTNLALLTYLVSMFVNNVKWNKRSKGKV